MTTGMTQTTAPSASTKLATCVACDDRAIVRAGLDTILGGTDQVATAEVCSLDRAVAAVTAHEPDVLVVAIRENDPEAFRVIATAKGLSAGLRVLVVAEGASVIDLREAVIAGVDSFLLTSASAEDIREGVAATARGERIVSPEVAMQLAGSWRTEASDAPASSLTPRELEVLQLLAEGLTNAQVAQRLSLSARTVKTHVQNLLSKLDVPDRTGAVARGFRLGLIR